MRLGTLTLQLPLLFALALSITFLGCSDVQKTLDDLQAKAEEEIGIGKEKKEEAETPAKKPDQTFSRPDAKSPSKTTEKKSAPKKNDGPGELAERPDRESRIRRIFGDQIADWLMDLEKREVLPPRLTINRNSKVGDFGTIYGKVKVKQLKSDRMLVQAGRNLEFWMFGQFQYRVGDLVHPDGVWYIKNIENSYVSQVSQKEIDTSNEIRRRTIGDAPASDEDDKEAKSAQAKEEKPAREFREWKSGSHTVEAKFKSRSGDKVKLEKKDGGKVITIAIDKLSEADQAYIKDLSK